MKAIETYYLGYKFRSRVEARWAVFLSAMGIEWEYEKEGFVLSDGTWYLPDFYLPKFEGGMFVEVKGEFTPEEIEKCKLLCKDSGKSVWMAEGTPDFRTYDVCYKVDDNNVAVVDASPKADQAMQEDRMYVSCEFANADGIIPQEKRHFLHFMYEAAVNAARSARFEHGETPTF